MKIYDKTGKLLTEPKVGAQKERGGQDVVFVVDQESKGLLDKILTTLKQINEKLEALD